MSVEQRLVDALRNADRLEPSPDLFSRVVHSIEEDRAHRRRVLAAAAATVITLAGLVTVAALAVVDGPMGRSVRPPVMEAVETAALVVLAVVMGPAIGRFGRGYAHDLWPSTPAIPTALVRLLDVAYGLVFAGYILVSTEIDTRWSLPAQRGRCLAPEVGCPTVAHQLESVASRVGGLFLTMGVLHALTLAVLPVVALVSNSTRVRRRLPRWLTIVVVIVGGIVGIQLVGAAIALALAGLGG